jgi:hypothetical protein
MLANATLAALTIHLTATLHRLQPTAVMAGTLPPDANPAPPWEELTSSNYFPIAACDAMLHHLDKLRADPARTGLTDPADPNLSSALVTLRADNLTLTGGLPDYMMRDDRIVKPLITSLVSSLTLAGHERFRSILRHVDQVGTSVGSRRAEAMTGFLPISVGPRGPAHIQPHHPALVGSATWNNEQCVLRLFQPMTDTGHQGKLHREDSAVGLDSGIFFPPLLEQPAGLHPAVERGHEVLLPGSCRGRVEDCSAVIFDTSVNRSYVTWPLVDCNQGYLVPHRCPKGGGTITGSGGALLHYTHVVPYLDLHFEQRTGHVRGVHTLVWVPVVDLPAGQLQPAPGWAACMGNDLLDAWGVWWHPYIQWRYRTEYPGARVIHGQGALMLSPTEAPGHQLAVAATNMSRTPIAADHPVFLPASKDAYQRRLGAQAASTGAPYLAGMPSVLFTVELYKLAAREQFTFTTQGVTSQVSLLRGVLHRHDYITYDDSPTGAWSLVHLNHSRHRILRLRAHIQQKGAAAGPLLTHPPVTTEGGSVGWYEGGIKAHGGRPFLLPTRLTTRHGLDRQAYLGLMYPAWQHRTPQRLDSFHQSLNDGGCGGCRLMGALSAAPYGLGEPAYPRHWHYGPDQPVSTDNGDDSSSLPSLVDHSPYSTPGGYAPEHLGAVEWG